MVSLTGFNIPNIRIATVIATASSSSSSITFSHNVEDHKETLLSQFNVGYIRCFITFCFKIERVCSGNSVCSIRGRKEEEKKVVREGMASSIQLHGEDSVVLRVTHSNLKTFNTDIRFSLQVHSFPFTSILLNSFVNTWLRR